MQDPRRVEGRVPRADFSASLTRRLSVPQTNATMCWLPHPLSGAS